MGFFKTTGLFILSALLILSLSVLIVAGSFHILLYPTPYEKVLDNAGVYGFIQNQTTSGELSFIKIESGNVKQEINRLLGNALSYVRGDTDKLDLNVEVDQTKLRNFFIQSINNLSICGYGNDPFVNNCKPVNLTTTQFLDIVIERRNITLLKQSSVNLADVLDKDNNVGKLRDFVGVYETLLWILVVLSFVFIILMFVLKRNEINSGLRWAGTSLIISGIIAMIAKIGESLAISNINLSETMQMFKPALLGLLGVVFGRIILWGSIVLVIGVILWVISFFFKKKA